MTDRHALFEAPLYTLHWYVLRINQSTVPCGLPQKKVDTSLFHAVSSLQHSAAVGPTKNPHLVTSHHHQGISARYVCFLRQHGDKHTLTYPTIRVYGSSGNTEAGKNTVYHITRGRDTPASRGPMPLSTGKQRAKPTSWAAQQR